MCALKIRASTYSHGNLRSRTEGEKREIFFHWARKTEQRFLSPSHVTFFGSWHVTSLQSSRVKQKVHAWCISKRGVSSQVTKWRWHKSERWLLSTYTGQDLERKARQVAHVWRSLLVVLTEDEVREWRGSMFEGLLACPPQKEKKEKKIVCVVYHKQCTNCKE